MIEGSAIKSQRARPENMDSCQVLQDGGQGET
jgi:hypothetical protein